MQTSLRKQIRFKWEPSKTCDNYDKSTLWRGTTLGRISIQERYWASFPGILSRNDRMTLKVKINDPHFQYRRKNSSMHISCKFVDSNSNPLQLSYHADKLHFPESWVKMAKWPWRSKPMIPMYHTSCEYHNMRVWFKFGDYSSNLWRVIARKILSLRRDGQTDGLVDKRPDASNDNTPSAWKVKG